MMPGAYLGEVNGERGSQGRARHQPVATGHRVVSPEASAKHVSELCPPRGEGPGAFTPTMTIGHWLRALLV